MAQPRAARATLDETAEHATGATSSTDTATTAVHDGTVEAGHPLHGDGVHIPRRGDR